VKVRIRIDGTSNTPIFEQIALGIEGLIVNGGLGAGDFLPSIREFATTHTINPNTVAKAFTKLQSEGWVESVRGTGLKVKRISERVADDRKDALVDAKIDELLEVTRRLAMSETELVRRIKSRHGEKK
jgi:GntR family transcriptional regulator